MHWLLQAYIRRTKIVQKMSSVSLLNTLGEAFGKAGNDNRIPPELMIEIMGGGL